ncbi:hypothetical protein D3C85_1021810 [compost metagenome]
MEVAGDHLREALATVLDGPGHARPAVVAVLPVSLAKALGRGHGALPQGHALFVAVAVQRRDHLAGVTRALLQHAVDQLAVQAVAEQLAVGGNVEEFVEYEAHVAQGCLVGHGGLLLFCWKDKNAHHLREAITIFEI